MSEDPAMPTPCLRTFFSAPVLSRLAIVTCLCLSSLPAQARKPVKRPSASAAEAEASQRFSRGVLALATRDFATAYREFSQAYRLSPVAEHLYQLGIVASVEGKTVEAQDLLRRYLVEAGESEALAAKRAEAQRILALPHGPAGQLRVVGEAGADVLLDDRLVGRLPLPRPLLVAAGPHKLTIVEKSGPKAGNPAVRTGGTTEAIVDGAALVVRELQNIAPLLRGRGAALDMLTPPSLTAIIEAEKLAGYDAAAANEQTLSPGCWEDGSCLVQLPEKTAPDLILSVEVTGAAAGAKLKLALLDVAGATLVGTAERGCESCTAEALQKLTGELLHGLVGSERRLSRGRLVVNATPSGAEIELSGWQLGRSPVEKQPLAGEYELTVKAPGHTAKKQRVTIKPDAPATVELALLPVSTEPPPPPKPELRWQQQRRPIWRLAVGIGAIAGGAAMAGLGAWALSLNGSCVDTAAPPMLACSSLYTTTGVGAGLVGGGAALAITGAIILAIPGPRRLVAVEHAAVHSGSKLAGRAAGN